MTLSGRLLKLRKGARTSFWLREAMCQGAKPNFCGSRQLDWAELSQLVIEFQARDR